MKIFIFRLGLIHENLNAIIFIRSSLKPSA